MGRMWQATRVTAQDIAAGKALQQLGYVKRQEGALRVSRMLRKFLDKNPEIRGRPAEAWSAFVGQLVTENRNGRKVRTHGTVLKYVTIADRNGIRPNTLDEAEARLANAAIKGGLSARKREEKKLPRYRQIAAIHYLCPIHSATGNKLYRTALYLLLATGSRAEHLGRMTRIRVIEKGVSILWGDRKIREARSTDLVYLFEWSCKPPRWMKKWLEAWPEIQEVLTKADPEKPENYVAAKRVNRFIDQRLGVHLQGLTSSFYRRRMSTLLLHETAAGRMNERSFGDLMDHTLGTGGSRYRLAGDPARLMLRQEALGRWGERSSENEQHKRTGGEQRDCKDERSICRRWEVDGVLREIWDTRSGANATKVEEEMTAGESRWK